MSENNKPELIIAEPEVLDPLPYDFEFITFALGLVPILNGEAAISLANIASIERPEEGDGWILTLINDQEYTLTEEDMANLDRLLRDRKAKRKDSIKDEYTAQMAAQAELQGNVAPAGNMVGIDGRLLKKGRFH